MDNEMQFGLGWREVTEPSTEAWKAESSGRVTAQVLSVGGVDTLRIRVEDSRDVFAPSVVQLSDGADLIFASKSDARAVIGAMINALQQQVEALATE